MKKNERVKALCPQNKIRDYHFLPSRYKKRNVYVRTKKTMKRKIIARTLAALLIAPCAMSATDTVGEEVVVKEVRVPSPSYAVHPTDTIANLKKERSQDRKDHVERFTLPRQRRAPPGERKTLREKRLRYNSERLRSASPARAH